MCVRYEVADRASCMEIGEHEWFEQSQEELTMLYNKVVVRGEV